MNISIEDYADLAEDVIKYSALVYNRNLVSAAGGNVSARRGNIVVITGSNVVLREVRMEDLVICDVEGNVLLTRPGLRPSKETKFHTGIYRLRPEVNYVIHAHPAYSTIWSIDDRPLPLYTRSAQLKLKDVPIVPDGDPGSSELADAVMSTVKAAPDDITAFLMKNHGIITMGKTMAECYNTAELLEDTAKIAVYRSIMSR